jgi:flagellar motor switch protein FliG
MPTIMESRHPMESLSAERKAAILLVSLGAEISAQIFKSMNEEEIESLTTEISRLGNVSAGTKGAVLEEFHQIAAAQEYITQGGVAYANEILERAVGSKRAKDILDRLRSLIEPAAFEFLQKVDLKLLLDFIRQEHPQTVALILANIQPGRAAQILAELPAELQADVVLRIATMDKTNPEVIKQIETILESRLASLITHDVSLSGGVKAVAEIMNRLDRSTEKSLLGFLQEREAELADTIRSLMFTFDDIVNVDDRGMQRILKEVDQRDLALALKAANPDVTVKVFKNMSERAGGLLKEEIGYLGPVRLKDVEESQRKIVEVVRRLEEGGEIIVLGRAGAGDVLV